jgi:hypothetical protein
VLKKAVLFLTLLITLLSVPVCAENVYIDFEFPSRLLLLNYEYKIDFAYSLLNSGENDFIIIPYIENGTIEIYDRKKSIWVKQNGLRSDFPKLEREMVVKITSFGQVRTKICFELQHPRSAAVYKSPCKTYWNRGYFTGYIRAINDKILKWEKKIL